MEAELQNFKSHSILCAKAELRDLKPKPLCVEVELRNVKSELSSIIPCAEAECQPLNSHNILCAQAELRNLKSQCSGDRT